MKKSIYTDCPLCNENGMEVVNSIVDGAPVQSLITCTTCGGTNKVSNSFLSDELMEFLDGINDKIDTIGDKVDNIVDGLE